MPQYNGILLVNKPKGITSHDAVDAVRKAAGTRKVGHTGTLDPLATGLLIICIGKATKLSQFLVSSNKTYEAEIRLGLKSTTYDAEGVIEESKQDIAGIDETRLESALNRFTGEILQKAPIFSAIKIGGKKLYELARKNENITTPERKVNISNIDLKSFEPPIVKINVSCSKGTYIRSLANDIGEELGCGAYLSELRRTVSGNFHIGDAVELNELTGDALDNKIMPIERALDYPQVAINELSVENLLNGQSLTADKIDSLKGSFEINDLISLSDQAGKLLAVGRSLINSSDLDNFRDECFFNFVRVLN